ncbi:MAG: hypothetical protein HBSAPP02_05310 [Phycisphaerae bacterium]|nr:MAG: S41 family peptidase [Planctomycetia bacterium]GJQ25499.1 MAG: hypothetical protein HBSAPP02_05310 [Phycisphaerae bacterium]
MTRRATLRLAVLALFVASAFRTTPLWAGPTDITEPALASASARELWRKGSDQVLSGDFKSAVRTLEQVQSIEPGHAQISSVLGWLKEAERLEANREKLRTEVYQYYVDQALKAAKEAREWQAMTPAQREETLKKERADKKAKADAAKQADGDKKDEDAKPTANDEGKDDDATAVAPDAGEMDEADLGAAPDTDKLDDKGYKWSKSLAYAQAAMANAASEEEFRKETWLKEIVSNVLVEIERHKEKREWRDAAALYSMLQGIFPKNKDYEDGFDYTSKRAHLDIVYGPKSTWRNDLRGVTAGSIAQILDRMDEDYVEEPDFKKLCLNGLEHLIILAQAESIASTFPTLGDKDLVDHFVSRLNGLIKHRVKAKASFNARQVRSVFNTVLDANNDSLRLPEAVLVDEFVSGMLEPLDEFTSVIWPSQVDDFNKHTRGDFVGVGIQITQELGKPVRVESPLEDSPAYKANIKPGDLITHVDGKSTIDININQAVNLITGEPGTKVVLTIEDSVSKKSRDVSLIRQHIKLRTVRGMVRDETRATGWDYFVDPDSKIGYVRVSGYMDKTVEDLEHALDQMEDEGCRGLILDLRFNPGGLLTAAVKMCELFVKERDPLVQTKGRNRQQNMEILARADSRFNRPLIVMVNEYSASASEIVAGALAGLQEACILGVRTFGKGSVQNLIPIMDNQAYLKLTTAYYYVYDKNRPGDPWYCLHRKKESETWGVEPHVTIKMIPMELSKVLRLRRERDVLKGRDQAEVPREILERRAASQPDEELPKDPDPDTDPQLVAAVNMMRLKLMSKQPWVLAPAAAPRVARGAAVEQRTPDETPR